MTIASHGVTKVVPATLRIAAALTLAATLFSAAETAQAQGQCSNTTLKGSYGSVVSGSRSIEGVTENFVGISLRSFDGDGNFVEGPASFHGATSGTQIVSVPTPGGTYQVNADCTGVSTLPTPFGKIVSNFVIVDNGKEVREIVMSPASGVVTANFKRL